MSAPNVARVLRQTLTSNTARHLSRNSAQTLRIASKHSTPATCHATQLSRRSFSAARRSHAGIMPHTADPAPREPEQDPPIKQATPIAEAEYHARADAYMDATVAAVEALQESREDVEVEYSAGVLSITFPPVGDYVLNKQPINKQIWLSSPTSGPKRFDWVLLGEGMDQKEGGGVGAWVYLRDGTTLAELLRRELGVTVDVHGDEEVGERTSVNASVSE